MNKVRVDKKDDRKIHTGNKGRIQLRNINRYRALGMLWIAMSIVLYLCRQVIESSHEMGFVMGVMLG